MIDEVERIHIPIEDFNKIMHYASEYIIQSFNVYTGNKGDHLSACFNLRNEAYFPDVNEEQLISEIENSFCVDYNKFSDKETLDSKSIGTTRDEQYDLRKILFHHKKTAKCCMCGKEYPVTFLVTAHVKRRALCSKEERLDFKNIVAPMCKFGCDELFEKGYIYVDSNGIIKSGNKAELNTAISKYIDTCAGRKCTSFTEESSKYYQYHRSFWGIDSL